MTLADVHSAPPPGAVVYPLSTWMPLLGHSLPGTLSQRNTVVLHITEGPTASGAIAWFAQSRPPNRISAHAVVDVDGKVYQLLDFRETAWHASQANAHSVGIEHAAISGKQPATEAQYEGSARLVAWVCGKLGIPIDRQHVRTHNEASPRDGHVLCCTGALDPDKVVRMAVEASEIAGH